MRAKPKANPEQHDAVAAATRMLAALNTKAPARKPAKLTSMWLNARQIWLERPAAEPAE